MLRADDRSKNMSTLLKGMSQKDITTDLNTVKPYVASAGDSSPTDAAGNHSEPQRNLILIGGNLEFDTAFMIRGDGGFDIERGERNGALLSLRVNLHRA